MSRKKNIKKILFSLKQVFTEYLLDSLYSNTHNVIIQNLTYNIDDQLDARMAKFIHMCLNHDNEVCRSISLSKLLCKNSTFASNYSYLSCKYNLSHHDWHLDTSHLIGKV